MPHIILISVIAGITALMAVLILIGKGDGLIAGYNTASEDEKKQYIMPRLRGVIAAILFCAAALVLIVLFLPELTWVFCVVFIVLVVVGLILANTWAKKK